MGDGILTCPPSSVCLCQGQDSLQPCCFPSLSGLHPGLVNQLDSRGCSHHREVFWMVRSPPSPPPAPATPLLFGGGAPLLLLLCGVAVAAIITGLFAFVSSSQSASHRACVPVFCLGGLPAVQKGASILRCALDGYRSELATRMKAIDQMLQVHLSAWRGQSRHPEITSAIKGRAWSAYQRIPSCWQVNEDVLVRLLSPPPFIECLPIDPSERATTASATVQNESQPSSSPSSSSSASASFKQGGAPSSTERVVTDDGRAYDDVVQVFTHLLRDWTVDGHHIRKTTYGPLLTHARKQLKRGSRVLVPGAGMCRLAFELATDLGHRVVALDNSIVMIAAAHSILTLPPTAAPFSFYPWVHDPLVNQATLTSRFKAATAPDRLPSDLASSHGSLSLEYENLMAFADRAQGQFDAVVTCFFIDTATNILDYLHAIHRVLRQGGYWINLGPLQYHTPLLKGGVQLALDEVMEAARLLGLEPIGPPSIPPRACEYRPEQGERKGPLRTEMYRPSLTVARKKPPSNHASN